MILAAFTFMWENDGMMMANIKVTTENFRGFCYAGLL